MKRFRHILNLLAACFILGVFAAILFNSLRVEFAERPDVVGNTPENIDRIRATADPEDFRFVVMGDVRRGTETFEKLLDIAGSDIPAFVVVLGDFVGRPEHVRHRLFLQEVSEENLPYGLFLVVGQHDVKGHHRADPGDVFDIEDFQQLYGPAQFHFSLGRCLFIFLNNCPPHDQSEEYLRYLEEALAERGQEIENTFLFMHVPPKVLDASLESKDFHGSEKFMELVRQYRVRYVFAGDHHGYVKKEVDGTTYIVTGGGGADLYGTHGRFHHMVRMAVDHDGVNDSVVAIEPSRGILETLERNIVVHVWPLMTGSIFSMAVTLIILAGPVWLLVHSVRQLKRPPGQASPEA